MRKLAEHLISIHKISHPFECDSCHVTFRSPESFSRHRRTHEPHKSYSCDLCTYSSYQRANLELHKRRHAKDYAHRCDLCDAGFMQRSECLEHRKAIHGLGDSPRHECAHCGRLFGYKRNLLAHLRLRHPEILCVETLVQCKLCARLLSDEKSLRKHEAKSHNRSGGPYSQQDGWLCDLCGLRLSSKQALEQHNQSHRGEKPVECKICGKGFSKRENLKVHLRGHTGERPYLCQICGRGFAQRTGLVFHMRLHTGDRPHKCGICGKAYVAASVLRKHAKKAHEMTEEDK